MAARPTKEIELAEQRKYRRFTAQQKLEIVLAGLRGDKSVRDVCREHDPRDPLRAARRLRTSTFFGAFELDPESGLQRGHSLAVIRWKRGRRHLLAGRVAGSSELPCRLISAPEPSGSSREGSSS